jgi:hypothetical protein
MTTAAGMSASAAVEAASATSGVTMEASAASYSTAAGKSATASIACTSVATTRSGAIAIAAIAVSAAEPGTCADEEAAVKPCRTVISVRGTSVGRVTVIAPLADGSTIIAAVPVSRVDTNPNGDLGMRVGRWNHQDTKQREIP